MLHRFLGNGHASEFGNTFVSKIKCIDSEGKQAGVDGKWVLPDNL